MQMARKDGARLWAEVHSTLLFVHDQPSKVISVARDVTAQRQARDERERLFEEVRAGRKRLESLSHHLVEMQEAERRHIALELHDEIGQALTGLRLSLELSPQLPANIAATRLAEAKMIVEDIIRRVESLSLDLRPPILDDLGLLPTLLWYFDRYSTRSGVRVECKHTGFNQRFPPAMELAVFRIVQESLTNVARHAHVNEVSVRVWATPRVLGVQVEDRGVGFDVERALSAGETSGVSGMRERVRLLGGQLDIESAAASGTRLTVELPLEDVLERREQPR
jgi:signal transduction histidine kinase